MPKNPPDSIIDSAIKAYPQRPLPPHFVSQVMVQLKPQPPARFRLHFLDIVLPIFITLFVVILLFVSAWLTGQLTVTWFPQIDLAISFKQPDSIWVGLGVATLVGEIAIAAWVCIMLWLDRPLLPSWPSLIHSR